MAILDAAYLSNIKKRATKIVPALLGVTTRIIGAGILAHNAINYKEQEK